MGSERLLFVLWKNKAVRVSFALIGRLFFFPRLVIIAGKWQG
jgi:hypothetical protein